MNQREKEAYLREYAQMKAEGKPFFPYAVAKDSLMGAVVIGVIITLSIVLGAELGPKANAATTTYTPRPEWYFFFLFELLRVIKPPNFTGLATIGVPTLGDDPAVPAAVLRPRAGAPSAAPPGGDRDRHLRDPRDGLPDLPGRQRRAADARTRSRRRRQVVAQGKAAVAQFYFGRAVVAQSGCEACHKIGDNGNDGPGPELTHIAARLPASTRSRARSSTRRSRCRRSRPLPAKQFAAAVAFLSDLK